MHTSEPPHSTNSDRFEIAFTDQPGPGPLLRWARIRMGTFEEYLEVPVAYWDLATYEQQWRTAVQRLLDGADRAVLMTGMHPPAHANFLRAWPMWRHGHQVTVQEQMLLLDELDKPFDETHPERAVGTFEETTEDGERVSTWRVPLHALHIWHNQQ